jgi:hypothetical protein
MRSAVATSDEGRQFLVRLSGTTFQQRLNALPGYASITQSSIGGWTNFLK